jgi:hypothetical protein
MGQVLAAVRVVKRLARHPSSDANPTVRVRRYAVEAPEATDCYLGACKIVVQK